MLHLKRGEGGFEAYRRLQEGESCSGDPVLQPSLTWHARHGGNKVQQDRLLLDSNKPLIGQWSKFFQHLCWSLCSK